MSVREYIPAQLPAFHVILHEDPGSCHAILARRAGGVVWQWKGKTVKEIYRAVNEAVEAQVAIEKART